MLLALVAAAVLAPLAARDLQVAGKAVAVAAFDGVDYVALSDLAGALGGRSWQVGSRLILVVPGQAVPGARSPGAGVDAEAEYVFRLDSAVVLSDWGRVSLPCPPVVRDSEVYVPAAALAELFPDVPAPVLVGVDVSARGDTAVLLLRVRRPRPRDTLAVSGRSVSSLEHRLVFGARVDSAVLAQARSRLAAGSIVRSLALDGTELVVGFRQPAFASAVTRSEGVELRAWPRPERRVKTIVLDAGHGGKDPGALGRVKRTEEKGIVLDVIKRLKGKLEKQGYTVLLTRDTDAYVPLGDRSRMANHSRADLFVSIHANSAPNRGACGFETYFLSEAKTDWERAVAARENAELDSGQGGNGGFGPGDLGLILADLAQNEFLHESSELAARIQEAAVPCARVKDRGVRQANFHVLRNDFMPAVLVECGFLSNKSEEKLLRQPQHREKLAEGIFRGIRSYCDGFVRRANGNGRG